jgi:hypothetical protein
MEVRGPKVNTRSKEPIGYTVQGIVAMAGGAGKVSKEVGVPIQSIAKWRYIPGWHAHKVAVLAGLPIELVRPDMCRAGHAEAMIYAQEKQVQAA